MSEISGIVRNGVERGWPLSEIRTSLINSGYAPQEIDYELKLVSTGQNSTPSFQQVPIQQTNQEIPAKQIPVQQAQPRPITPMYQEKFNPQDLTNYQTPPIEKKASNFVLIMIIVLLVLCVLAGAGLYLFGG